MTTARITDLSGDSLDIVVENDAVVENVLQEADRMMGPGTTVAAYTRGNDELLNQARRVRVRDLPQEDGIAEIMVIREQLAIKDVVRVPGFELIQLPGGPWGNRGCGSIRRKFAFFLNNGTIIAYFSGARRLLWRGRAHIGKFGFFCILGDKPALDRFVSGICSDYEYPATTAPGPRLGPIKTVLQDRGPSRYLRFRDSTDEELMPALYTVGTNEAETSLMLEYFRHRMTTIFTRSRLDEVEDHGGEEDYDPTREYRADDIDRVFETPVESTPTRYRKVFSKTALNRHFRRLDAESDDAMRTALTAPLVADTTKSHWTVKTKRKWRRLGISGGSRPRAKASRGRRTRGNRNMKSKKHTTTCASTYR